MRDIDQNRQEFTLQARALAKGRSFNDPGRGLGRPRGGTPATLSFTHHWCFLQARPIAPVL